MLNWYFCVDNRIVRHCLLELFLDYWFNHFNISGLTYCHIHDVFCHRNYMRKSQNVSDEFHFRWLNTNEFDAAFQKYISGPKTEKMWTFQILCQTLECLRSFVCYFLKRQKVRKSMILCQDLQIPTTFKFIHAHNSRSCFILESIVTTWPRELSNL